MEKKDLELKLKEIILSVSDSEIEEDSIDVGIDGIKKLGLNSLAIVRMMVEIEKEFDIEMDVYDTEDNIFNSICVLADYINKKMTFE